MRDTWRRFLKATAVLLALLGPWLTLAGVLGIRDPSPDFLCVDDDPTPEDDQACAAAHDRYERNAWVRLWVGVSLVVMDLALVLHLLQTRLPRPPLKPTG